MSTQNQAEYRPVVSLLPRETFTPAFKNAVVVGSMVSSAIAFMPAFAQNAPEQQLDAVNVVGETSTGYQAPATASSPKMTAPLVDTPRSVTIITEELIRDRGATSLLDVLRTTPGITLGAGEGGTPTGDRPFIRGYEASTDIFIDGMRDYARGSHETFNLESVEVVKGPSSSYTGRGGTGGSINLATKAPKEQDFMEATAGFGNAGQWRTTVDGNVTFSETGAFRLNLMKMGGEVPGRDGVEVDRMGIAPSIAFGLGTPTRVTLSYSRIENHDMPDQGIPFQNAANPGRLTPPKVDRDNFYGRANVDFRENNFDTLTARIEHDFSDRLTIRNTTRHVKTLNHYLLTRPSFDNCTAGAGAPCSTEGPGAEFRRSSSTRWRATEALINQTDLFGRFELAGMQHNFAAGLEFSHEDVFSRTMAGAPGNEQDSLYAPNPYRSYNVNLTYGPKLKDGDIKVSSLYLIDTMKINEQWSVNAGARYDKYQVRNTTDQRKDNMFNYQLGLVYKPAANGSVYLMNASSSNPSGENLGQNGGADGVAGAAQIRDLKPEKSQTWELGTKWDLMEGRLSLTGAVFETEKTDARSTDPLTGLVSLNGNNRVRGVELGASGFITKQMSVWAGVTYLDPKIVEYRNGATSYAGKQMKFIAKQSADIWLSYAIQPNFSVGGGASYMGKRFVDDANVRFLPSHVRYDAMARYDINKNLTLQFNVNNISNTEIYDASHIGLFANVGAGRSYMLNAIYRFN